LYLARANYRSRRLADAARLLPVLGAFLMLLPVLWQPGPAAAGAHDTGPDGLYLFGVWAGLILAAVLMARHLVPQARAAEDEDEV
jgi:hypothetical protein